MMAISRFEHSSRYTFMSDLSATRWTRFGHDRVYVKTADGTQVGHIDLVTGARVLTATEFEAEFAEIASQWQPTPAAPPQSPDPTAPGPAATDVSRPQPAAAPMTPPLEPGRDLAVNVAGAAARAKRDEVNQQAPVLNLFARALGIKTEERAWRVGAKGEEKVGKQLDGLPAGWHALHAVPVGDNGSDIDHVVIGPGGVFTLNTKRHPTGKATVYEHKIYVNGAPTDYLRNSRFEARRANRLLTAACGIPVAVTAAIVFVDLDTFTVKAMPDDVHVTTRRRLRDWLTGLPAALDPAQVDHIHTHARNTTTWTPAS